MRSPKPLMFLSDSPDLNTGLGRIGRNLASFLSRSPDWRVGYLGLGGVGSRRLPFPQYVIQRLAGEWGQGVLELAWNDFARGERGIVFTIWDLTRLHWFARTGYYQESMPQLAKFMQAGHFEKWGYVPVDSQGPGGKLTGLAADTLLGYDRIVAYTKWGMGVIEATIGEAEAKRRKLTWLPHGVDFEKFQPRNGLEGRRMMGPMVHDDDFVIGAVGTNQARKDWGLVIATVALLRQSIPSLRLWIHVDVDERHWSIPALLTDFGMLDATVVTHELTDEMLSWHYSACDVTLHPGLGEGFGFPIVESLASGTPAIHGNYGGGVEAVGSLTELLIEPTAMRLDTLHNCYRPVFHPREWAQRVMELREKRITGEECRAAVSHFDWKNLWPACWETFWSEAR